MALSVAGCETSSNSSAQKINASAPAVQPGVITSSFTSQGQAPLRAQGDYRIGPSDVLSVSVFQVPDLTVPSVQVSGDGMIALPLIGSVRAAGQTARQLEAQIAAKLRARYLQSPQVTVEIKDFASQQFTVEGSVNKPGVFPMPGGSSTLLRAIATASGFDSVADKEDVVVFRMSGGQKTAARFDMSAIRDGKAEDPEILSGDVIVVESSTARTTLRDLLQVLPAAGLFAAVI